MWDTHGVLRALREESGLSIYVAAHRAGYTSHEAVRAAEEGKIIGKRLYENLVGVYRRENERRRFLGDRARAA